MGGARARSLAIAYLAGRLACLIGPPGDDPATPVVATPTARDAGQKVEVVVG
jgi:hypothetical protein